MYAQLVKRLSEEVQHHHHGPTKNQQQQQQQQGEEANDYTIFMRILLNTAKNRFEERFNYYSKSGSKPIDEDNVSPDDEEKQHVAKQKMLGNIKFIGELFLLDQINGATIHKCILQLLDFNKVSPDIQVRCQDMECLCQLIRTCGKSLDTGQGKQLMDQYFLKMAKRSQTKVYPPRIRFMLRDMIELRDNGWTPRSVVSNTQGPVPIHLLRGDDDLIGTSELAATGQRSGGRGGDSRHHGDRGDSSDSSSWMTLIPGFNDMFNSLSMGTTSTSSMLPPPPPMHNNHYLNNRDNNGDRHHHHQGRNNRDGDSGQYGNNRDNYHHNDRGGYRGDNNKPHHHNNYRNHNNRNQDGGPPMNNGQGYGGYNHFHRGGGNNNNNDYRDNNSYNNYNNMNNGYSNNNNGGDRSQGGAQGGYRNNHRNNSGLNNNGNQNYSNNRYNNNNGKHNYNMNNQHNSGGAPYNNQNSMMGGNKDLAPRFKRNLMTSGGGNNSGGSNSPTNSMQQNVSPSGTPGGGNNSNGGNNNGDNVENLQMRPAANSLLFKANTMNVNKQQLPLTQPQQRVIPTNSMMNSQTNHPYQGRGSDPSSSPFRQSPNQFNDRFNNQQQSTNQFLKDNQEPAKETPSSKTTPQMTVVDQKQAEVAKINQKQKKKDKGVNKEEIMKKFSVFLQETYFQKMVTTIIQENKEGQEKGSDEETSSETIKTDETSEEVKESEEKVEEEKAEEPRIQTLNEITKKFIDLKVPEKFSKDCLSSLFAEVLEMSHKQEKDLSKDSMTFVQDWTSIDDVQLWDLSQEERCIVFVAQLKKEAKMGQNAVNEAFKQAVSTMSEKESSIPRIQTLVSDLISHAILKKVMTLSELASITENGKHYPLILTVLQRLNQLVDKKDLTELFNASKVNLMNCLPEVDRNKDRMAVILDERSLAFLYPLLKVQSELWKQIQIDSNPQQFYKWIKENVDSACLSEPGFVTALMTVLLKHITQETTLPEGMDLSKNPDKSVIEKERSHLEKYCPVLNAFLTNGKLQLVAIYALQVYCHSVNFPKGMLLRWFTALYDLNVIEEETYFQWKEDLTDLYPGKQKALFQVNTWLTWLQEVESEEDEDDG